MNVKVALNYFKNLSLGINMQEKVSSHRQDFEYQGGIIIYISKREKCNFYFLSVNDTNWNLSIV